MGNRKRPVAVTSNPFRNLEKADLGGVIFGCTDKTVTECLSKQLFGLPSQHFGYVKNIDPGLPLFLFNYSRRALHGIYEAASVGQLNINPYGWTKDGSDRTSFPAQVLIRTRKNCRPLLENQFSPIIEGNYYTQNHFRFELDHVQANKLVALFSTQVVAPPPSAFRSTGNLKILNPRQLRFPNGESDGVPFDDVGSSKLCNESNDHLIPTNPSTRHEETPQCITDDMEVIETRVHESLNTNTAHLEAGGSHGKENAKEDDVKDNTLLPLDYPSIIAQLMLEVRELKSFKEESIKKMGQMEQKLCKLESEVDLSQGLDDRMPVTLHCNSKMHGVTGDSCSDQQLDSDDFIYLTGGYDGKSWLASVECYYPSKDMIKSLCPMLSARSYASLARLNGDIYVVGGGSGGKDDVWYDTVECYSPVNNDWTSLACLSKKKGSLAAVTLHDKIFALGGGNGVNCFSDVEMLDLDVGRWISGRSMLQKRFAVAAVEFNGALYATGGFDGIDYLSSTERFDPREHSWSTLGSMHSKRGCHAMLVLNEKFYAIGGFNGSAMVDSVEVFDPRVGTWITDVSMNYQRGYCAAAVLNNNIYAIGGLDASQKIVRKVERYEEGHGWEVTELKAIGQRCFASAIV
ncbi:hypothetical protein RND81_13G068000 [Saponaria officinalis]|uniref:DCD domain-containing protein n=1 Tax=Saponaria officinalis TaxID=3572 RepID=A0AAW1GXJ4_SAPOF